MLRTEIQLLQLDQAMVTLLCITTDLVMEGWSCAAHAGKIRRSFTRWAVYTQENTNRTPEKVLWSLDFCVGVFHEFLLTNFAGDEIIQGTDFDSSTPSERCRRALTSQYVNWAEELRLELVIEVAELVVLWTGIWIRCFHDRKAA